MSNGSGNYPALQTGADGGQQEITRAFPCEAPVALEYNGVSYAVMMATPLDLEDFAYGFSLSEQIISHPDQINALSVQQSAHGWLVRIEIDTSCMPQIFERVRNRLGEGSCGLCGLESLEALNRPLPTISIKLDVKDAAIFAALDSLRAHQPLNQATGGAHAAAFCDPQTGAVLQAREDVGRHNALDKLIGALARENILAASGFFIVSARCSYELAEKSILAGCPLLVSVSTATDRAIDSARTAGLQLVALARSDSVLRL